MTALERLYNAAVVPVVVLDDAAEDRKSVGRERV